MDGVIVSHDRENGASSVHVFPVVFPDDGVGRLRRRGRRDHNNGGRLALIGSRKTEIDRVTEVGVKEPATKEPAVNAGVAELIQSSGPKDSAWETTNSAWENPAKTAAEGTAAHAVATAAPTRDHVSNK